MQGAAQVIEPLIHADGFEGGLPQEVLLGRELGDEGEDGGVLCEDGELGFGVEGFEGVGVAEAGGGDEVFFLPDGFFVGEGGFLEEDVGGERAGALEAVEVEGGCHCWSGWVGLDGKIERWCEERGLEGEEKCGLSYFLVERLCLFVLGRCTCEHSVSVIQATIGPA